MTVPTAGTVTLWISQIKAGNREAANQAFQKIWDRYSARMAGLAQRRLQGQPSGLADAEDVLQSVFRVTFQRARAGMLNDIDDRDDLWKLLIGITAWKARDQIRKQNRQKRGNGLVLDETALREAESAAGGDLAQFAVTNSTPEMHTLVAEELERLLALLGSEEESLRIVAEMKMEGAEHWEIQKRINCSPRTVERKLRRIRQVWEKGLQT